jgi:hypothetical protein
MQEVTEWRRETLFTNITYLNDLAIDDEFSVVKSPNGTFWRISVDDTGQINVKPLGIVKDPINPDAPLIPYATADDISYSSDVSGFNPNPPTIGNALNMIKTENNSMLDTISTLAASAIESMTYADNIRTVKFANGLQICWGSVYFANSAQNQVTTITVPSFIAAPHVLATGINDTNSYENILDPRAAAAPLSLGAALARGPRSTRVPVSGQPSPHRL